MRLCLLALLLVACAGTTPAAGLVGLYTEHQAAEGKLGYDKHCAECHHLSLRGTGHGPQLAGPNSLVKWGKQSIASLDALSTAQMPAGAPHSLTHPRRADQEHRAV